MAARPYSTIRAIFPPVVESRAAMDTMPPANISIESKRPATPPEPPKARSATQATQDWQDTNRNNVMEIMPETSFHVRMFEGPR